MPHLPPASQRAEPLRSWGRPVVMMALFFLVVCAVGILRPIRNSLALDGLGATGFYKVYLVSAVVVLFAPAYNRLSDRVPPRRLIPAVALFFAANLALFRVVYRAGSPAFGLAFYGWYDLFAAALVTQLFMATQLFFDARLARGAYPVVIAGGSLGATLGGAITGFFADSLGTPNLMLVAAGFILLFGLALPVVWVPDDPTASPRRRPTGPPLARGDLARVWADRHVRLIAAMVLVTILVKQLVDYEFNALTKQVFQDRDAVTAFQGRFNAATQWLPIVVLAALHPALRRWGMGVAVLLLPVAMLLTNGALLLAFGLWGAVAAKGAETALRYSAERAGREILYVPVAPDIKLKAKAYIDVAVEKGLGKVCSAGLIFVLLRFMDARWIPAAAVALAVGWTLMALTVKREYVRALSRAIAGRFASPVGLLASLADATTLPVLGRALEAGGGRAAFALDLLERVEPAHAGRIAPSLRQAFRHDSPDVRARALGLARRLPDVPAEAYESSLLDPEPAVREAAARAWVASGPHDPAEAVRRLLGDPRAEVRNAVLACVARGELGGGAAAAVRRRYAGRSTSEGEGSERRVEALFAGAALGGPAASDAIGASMEDTDPRVRSAALRAAGLLGTAALDGRLVGALADPAVRDVARSTLAGRGVDVVAPLAARLLDPGTPPAVRRQIPSVLARIPAPVAVEALVRCAADPETDQVLDYRALKALSRLRARHPDLPFDPDLVDLLITREIESAGRFRAALRAGEGGPPRDGSGGLLTRALAEAWRERREGAFRALGLLHPPDAIHRCFLAIRGGDRIARSHALEWLESVVGHRGFNRFEPVLRPDPGVDGSDVVRAALDGLSHDEDRWIGELARRASGNGSRNLSRGGGSMMDAIDKALLLQRVDVLREARTAHLALLAAIAEEVEVDAGTVLLRRGEPVPALYAVIDGTLSLRGDGGAVTVGEGAAVGAWSLVDGAPGIADARADAPVRALRIAREEFYDLLTDYPEIAIGIMQGLAGRMRSLVS